jgi:hypothetical protein
MALGSWRSFERDIANMVKLHQKPGLQFCAGYTAIPGFPYDGFRADALLTDGKHLLAVEVELKQANPETNVGKYWILSKYRSYESVLLFHIYTPAFNSYPWRLKLGCFYAEKMQQELPFEYVLLDRRKDVDPGATLKSVQLIIEPRIQQLFP